MNWYYSKLNAVGRRCIILAYRNNKGAALAVVLMMLAVFSILGVAILSLSLSETRFTAYESKKMKAYYIARSGAEAAAKWFSDPANAAAVAGFTNDASNPNFSGDTILGEGVFSLKVYRKETGEVPKIIIESTGRVPASGTGSVSQKEVLELNKDFLFRKAIYASGDLNNDSNSIVNGDVEAMGDIANVDKINGDYIEHSTHTYPAPVFPNTVEFEAKFGSEYFGEYPTTLHMPNHPNPTLYSEWRIDSDTTITDSDTYKNNHYRKITVQSSNKLTFDIHQDFRVLVDDFSALNVEIEVKTQTSGTQGRLIIYVNNALDFKGEILSPPETIYIFGNDGAQITMQTGSNIYNGYIYGPGANVNYKSGTYSGAIVGKNVDLGSGGVVNYVGTGMSYIMPEDFGINSFGYSKGLWSH